MTISGDQILKQSRDALYELLSIAELVTDEIVVIGCSTSEIIGEKIGTASSAKLAENVYDGLKLAAEAYAIKTKQDIFLAIQCCEHLNRALLIDKNCQLKYDFEKVTAIPSSQGGGSLPEVAYKRLEAPVMVEKIRGNAGIDIGNTIIGMHLKPVVVPVRLAITNIGLASCTAAITRPKLIGGERVKYKL